jgi:hypothetical protein
MWTYRLRRQNCLLVEPVLSPESRRAVIATEKSVFGMFRLAQAYHDMTQGHSHLGVFYDRDEALRWLGNK